MMVNTLESPCVHRGWSKTAEKNHLECLVKHNLRCSTYRASDSESLRWGFRICISTSSQDQLLLVVQRSHFENYCCTVLRECFNAPLLWIGKSDNWCTEQSELMTYNLKACLLFCLPVSLQYLFSNEDIFLLTDENLSRCRLLKLSHQAIFQLLRHHNPVLCHC